MQREREDERERERDERHTAVSISDVTVRNEKALQIAASSLNVSSAVISFLSGFR